MSDGPIRIPICLLAKQTTAFRSSEDIAGDVELDVSEDPFGRVVAPGGAPEKNLLTANPKNLIPIPSSYDAGPRYPDAVFRADAQAIPPTKAAHGTPSHRNR